MQPERTGKHPITIGAVECGTGPRAKDSSAVTVVFHQSLITRLEKIRVLCDFHVESKMLARANAICDLFERQIVRIKRLVATKTGLFEPFEDSHLVPLSGTQAVERLS